MGGIFKAETTPLDKGFLLEASAGTGKTYSLVKIVTRLIRDEGVPLDKILVVTFTNKAAAEMKSRIREGLREIVTKTGNLRCRQALDIFDEAPVYTIHGFCQQVLSRWPLESGMPFQIELNNEGDSAETGEMIVDYLFEIQDELQNDPVLELFYKAARSREADFSAFIGKIKSFLINWNKLFAGQSFPDSESCQAILKLLAHLYADFTPAVDCFQELLETLPSAEELVKISRQTPGKGSARKTCQTFIDNLQILSRWENASLFFDECFSKEGSDILNQVVSQFDPQTTDFENTSWGTAVDRFIALFDPLLDPFATGKFRWRDEVLPAFLFYRKLAIELSGRIREKRISSGSPGFDDLIFLTHQLICRNSGDNPLSESLRSCYSLALIDEFQDTDSFQWKIFSTLFLTSEHRLFLIGDPKQSIYSFRNADLNIYYEAANKIGEGARYCLDTNYRSRPALVDAVNYLCRDLFLQPSLDSRSPDFEPVKAGKEKSAFDKTPVVFLKLDGEEMPHDPYQVIATQIVSLLNDPEESISPGDIVFLSDRYQELNALQECLNRLGIPSVLYEDKAVNESGEISLLTDIMEAIVYPGKAGKLKKMLLSDFYPLPASLVLKMEESGSFAPWQILLTRARERLEKGELFDAVFSLFSCGETLRQSLAGIPESYDEISGCQNDFRIRLLARPGGSRVSTNLMHLLEILNRLQKEKALDPVELLEEMKNGAFTQLADEERLQRLDSDSDAVQLMTMFKSKGLEFPIVFFSCFKTNLLPTHSEYRLFNRKGNQCRLMINDSDFREEEIEMVWQERLRLMYVTLTRASNRLFIPYSAEGNFPLLSSFLARFNWNGFQLQAGMDSLKKDRNNRIIWPLQRSTGKASDFKELLGRSLERSLEKLVEEKTALFSIISKYPTTESYVPETSDEIYGYYRASDFPFYGRIIPISSFTSLSSSRELVYPESDKDYHKEDSLAEEAPETEDDPIFLLPGGVDFGQMVHSLFEELDWKIFSGKEISEEQNELFEQIISRFYSPLWQKNHTDTVRELVRNTLNVILLQPDCSLGQIGDDERKAEIEFLLSCRNEGKAILEGREYLLDGGMLKGYIDLVFKAGGRYYLADWKTNRPGAGRAVSDYGEESLEEIMEHHQYKLQYYLYLSALIPYLETVERDFIYERDFGGVYYFFVRGMREGEKTGIYFDRPDYNQLKDFAESFRESKL